METHWFTWICLVGDVFTDCTMGFITMFHHHLGGTFPKHLVQIQVHFAQNFRSQVPEILPLPPFSWYRHAQTWFFASSFLWCFEFN